MKRNQRGAHRGYHINPRRQPCTVHTTLKEFENGVFTLKTKSNVFRPHYARAILKRQQPPGHFGFVFGKGKVGQGNHVIIVTSIVFEKLHFQNVFCPHENEKPAFSNSSGLKSVFEKLYLRDG